MVDTVTSSLLVELSSTDSSYCASYEAGEWKQQRILKGPKSEESSVDVKPCLSLTPKATHVLNTSETRWL